MFEGGGSVVVDILINVLPIVYRKSVFVYVLLCINLCPFYFCNHLKDEEKAGCFAITVLQMWCYYKCSVAFPHGAVGGLVYSV